jgi:peptidyl-prolyl cis-trans isomerase SurA
MRRVIPVAVAMLVVLGAGVRAQQKSTIIQKIIVKVNGEILTQTDLEDRQIEALKDRNPQLKGLEDFQSDAQLQAALAEVTPDVLVKAVDELLLVQRARELGIRFSDENFKSTIDNIKKQNNLDDEGLKKAMAQEGITLEELRENFERAFMIQRVQSDEIGRNLNITEQESRQYYTKHPNEFLKPATVTVREVFVAVPTVTGADGKPAINAAANEEALAKLKTARERAAKGEDFAAIVAEISESGTKANGGLIGPVLMSDLNPALAERFSKLQPGEITEPIRTADGYQIFKLETRSAAEPLPFEEVRGQILNRIYQERIDVELVKYLGRLRETALIEWKDPAYKQLYDKRRTELAASKS